MNQCIKHFFLFLFISSFIYPKINKNLKKYIPSPKNYELIKSNSNVNKHINSNYELNFFKNKKKLINNKFYKQNISLDDNLFGYWSENFDSRKIDVTLNVTDVQEIPNPTQVMGFKESNLITGKSIIVDGGENGTFNLSYLPSNFGPYASNVGVGSWNDDIDLPIVEFHIVHFSDMTYVFRPDSVAIVIYTGDSTGTIIPTFEIISGENVVVNAGDEIFPIFFADHDSTDEDEDFYSIQRLIHGITIDDTLAFTINDPSSPFFGTQFHVSGDIKHDKVVFSPETHYSLNEIFGDTLLHELFYGFDDEESNSFEFFDNGLGNDIVSQSYGYWNEYDEFQMETYTDTMPFHWTTYNNIITITETVEDYVCDDDFFDCQDEIYEEQFKLNYSVSETTPIQTTLIQEEDFCNGWDLGENLSPYDCGDQIKYYIPIWGLDGLESAIMKESRIYDLIDKNISYSTNSDGFHTLYPSHESLITIDNKNAWTDTLTFIWEKADHLFMPGSEILYQTELHGDLSKFFLLTGATNKTSWKFPYNQIKSNMHQAGMEIVTGSWNVTAKGKILVGDISPGIIGDAAEIHGPKISDNSFYFDGIDDKIVIHNDNTNFENNSFTISLDIKTNQEGKAGILLKSDQDDIWEEGEFHLYLENGNISFVGFDNEFIRSTGYKINDGNWHNIVIINEAPISTDPQGLLKYLSTANVWLDGKIYKDPGYTNYRSDDIENSDILKYSITLGVANNSESFDDFKGNIKNLSIFTTNITSGNADLINSGKDPVTDLSLSQDMSGYWKLNAFENAGEKTINVYALDGSKNITIDASSLNIDQNTLIPNDYKLHSNYPNPFNPTTTIQFDIPKEINVELIVYDIMGNTVSELINTKLNPGYHKVLWNGTDNFGNYVSAGLYVYQIKAGDYINTQKMLFIK